MMMMIMPKNNNDVSGNIGKIIKVGMSDFSYFSVNHHLVSIEILCH